MVSFLLLSVRWGNWADGIIGGCEGCCEEEAQAQVCRGCSKGTEKSIGEDAWREEDGHFRLIPALPLNICYRQGIYRMPL